MTQADSRKFGFIGVGNMAQAIISAWIDSGIVPASSIFASNRTPGKLKKICEQFKIQSCATNEELIDQCQIVILAMKPQDMVGAMESISSSFTSEHIVISLAAGVTLSRLKRLLPEVKQWVRVMPNTPARIRRGVSGYCLPTGSFHLKPLMDRLLEPLGAVFPTEDEDHLTSLAIASSAGVGFVFELMQYWQEWLEEHDFSPDQAREITVKTFLGTALLADQNSATSILDLQARVTSKKGITAAGLDSMRELEIERLLRYSLEKSALRDREIAEEQNG